jgi:hypothetical protein
MAKLNHTIFVDLDGTVRATNLLVEGLIRLLSRQSRRLAVVPYRLWCGCARLKQEIARRIDCIDPGLA